MSEQSATATPERPPTSGDIVVNARDLSRSYSLGRNRTIDVLRGTSLQIHRGEALALMGPSGSGKSTLLHLLGLLDHPNAGTIEIDGVDVSSLRGRAAARVRARQIGFIFQHFNLLPELTARDNVALAAEYAGTSRKDARTQAGELLGRVGLADRLDHRPSELSGGEQQRVTIARALINGPAIVLADEPTGNLDSSTSAEVMALLLQLKAELDQSLMIVTHDPGVAAQCDRTVRMLDGVVLPD